MGISVKTRKMLWGRSGNRCALPSCRRLLVEDETETDDASIVGDEAHIVAKEIDGPRGISVLNPEQRDKYDNLILMCKVHHKLIDDQSETFTVEYLHRMKINHIEWVNTNLNPDVDKQRDDEIYATYIDKWSELAGIDNWKNWSSYVLSNGQPEISVEQYNKFKELEIYLLSRVWPKRYDIIEFSLMNFKAVLSDFLNVFDKFKHRVGSDDNSWYSTEKIYQRLNVWDNEKYSMLANKFNFQVDIVQDLMCELTRAGNFVCDQIRKYISSSFKIHEGVLLIQTGPNKYMEWVTVREEFETSDLTFIKYPGLRKFMETRAERGYCFGDGVSEDYFR